MHDDSARYHGLDATSRPTPLARRLPRWPELTPASRCALVAFMGLGVSLGVPEIGARAVAAQSLQGSHESMLRQNLVAQQHDYPYLRTPREVEQAVDGGALIQLSGNEDYSLAGEEVSFPYARAEVRTFIEQLAHAYRAACGEPLVVTSLVRPISNQPWNASPISVHPTGMAVDLRRSDRRVCRQWIESTLLALEGEGMVEAIRERWPAHYHVAVFPDPLLLPGPIGDPNGVIRLAALHRKSFGTIQETDSGDEPIGRTGRVRLSRSARTGRLRITQTSVVAAARRSHSGRISLHRAAASRHRSAATSATTTASLRAGAVVSKHRHGHAHPPAARTPSPAAR
jgi:hypothetical protein